MVEFITGVVLLALHLFVCLALWVLVRVGVLDIKGHFFPFLILVPVWGPLCVVLLHTRNALLNRGITPPTLEKLRINEELHRSILVEDREDNASVVPLEEALLVNSTDERRRLILSVLTDDPTSYYELLQQARMNEDSEVVHYAATALAQISKEADLKLQQKEHAYAAAPDDYNVLDAYCEYLEEYIASGLVQGRAAEIQRRQLEQLLKKRLAIRSSYDLLCRLVCVQLDLHEYDTAEKNIARLIEKWPQREIPWLLQLRSAAARRDGPGIQRILHQIDEQHVYLSALGRETIDFWRGEKEGRTNC